MVNVLEFDASALLDDEQLIAEYLAAALEEDDPAIFLAAVGHVAYAGYQCFSIRCHSVICPLLECGAVSPADRSTTS